MPGFITQGGNAADGPFDTSQVPSSVFEGQNPFGTSEDIIQGLNRLTDNAAAAVPTAQPTRFSTDITASAPAPMLTAQQANDQYGGAGLKFNNPLPQDVAQDMRSAKDEENMRADVAARSENPIGRAAVSFAAGLLDPVNVAASFLPVIGEGNVARMLGTAGAESIGAKVATRAATGAIQGAAGGALLGGVQTGLATQSQQDFTMSDALKSTFMGAMFGGVLHPLAGAVHDVFGETDPISQGFSSTPAADAVSADPLIRQQAGSAAIAAALEDRPVDVAPLIELSTRQREQALALRSMQYDSTQPTSARFNALEDDMTRPGVPDALSDNLAQQHEALLDTQASEADLAGVQDQPVDPVTQERLNAIDEELTKPGPLSASRQQALFDERRMLTEGSVPLSPDDIALNAARAQAQRQGNLAAIQRNNDRITALQNQIRDSATVRQALGAGSEGARTTSANADAVVKINKPIDAEPDDADGIAQIVNGMKERGTLSTESEAELAAADEGAAHSEAMAKAHESFATCMAGL